MFDNPADVIDLERFVADDYQRVVSAVGRITGTSGGSAAEEAVQHALVTLLRRGQKVAHPVGSVAVLASDDELGSLTRFRPPCETADAGGGSKDAPDDAQSRSRGYGIMRISEDSSITAGHVLNRSMRADDFFRDSSFLSRVAGRDQSLHSCNRRNEHGA